MTLESIFYISQTIAAFAIVGSLLFVGLEVRTSNRENRHRTIEEMLQNYRELRGTVASNADGLVVHRSASRAPRNPPAQWDWQGRASTPLSLELR